MRLQPKYDAEPLVAVAAPVDDPAVPLLRQRRRLGDVLRRLADEQWAAPSRCEAWTVQGVVSHLVGTNQFWALSMQAAPEEEPDEILGSLRYAAALGPAFGRTQGDERTGRLGVVVHEPDASFLVEVGTSVVVTDGAVPDGTPTLRGPAIDVLEGLSLRVPLTHDLAEEDRWLVGGLGVVFDRG